MRLGRSRDPGALILVRRCAGCFHPRESQDEKEDRANELADYSNGMAASRIGKGVEYASKELLERVDTDEHGLAMMDIHYWCASDVGIYFECRRGNDNL